MYLYSSERARILEISKLKCTLNNIIIDDES